MVDTERQAYTKALLGKEQREPQLTVSFAGQPVDIPTALRFRRFTYRTPEAPAGERRPGDNAADYMLGVLARSGLTPELYRKATPHLFEYAAKEGGGFDSDFIAVALQEFVRTGARMGVITPEGNNQAASLSERDQAIYFGRAYGRIETIKENIWDNPAMRREKEELIRQAKEGLAKRASHLQVLSNFS
jgi:hypothetical protein